jgi:hypothetical protein
MQATASKYYTLQQATKHRTRSGLIPFVIAHEVREPYKDSAGQEQMRTRVFYAFENLAEFERVRKDYPNAHEVIWDRYAADKQQGRLIFDFDFDHPWAGVKPNFVPKDFQTRIQEVVVKTFDTFYKDVDTSKFVWVWLISDTVEKWSKHLIVKHAFFSHDWKAQMSVFYNLFLSVAQKSGYFPLVPFEGLIDMQVARTGATMRMCGSSKIGGKVLTLESPADATFEDTLVQLHTYQTIRKEQHITETQLRKDVLDKLFFEHPEEVVKDRFLKGACDKCHIDLSSYYEASDRIITQEMVDKSYQTFEKFYCDRFQIVKQEVFMLGPSSSQFITLKRLRSAPCLISGKVHDAENACIIVQDNSIKFYCRRDCQTPDGSKCLTIYEQVE